MAIPLEIAEQISDFIAFSSYWSVYTAGERGRPRLMRLLLARVERSSHVDEFHAADLVNRYIDIAACAGQCDVVEGFLQFFPHVVVTRGVREAAQMGHATILSILKKWSHRVIWTDEALEDAVESGHVLAARLVAAWCPVRELHPVLCFKAAIANDRPMVEWLWPEVVASEDVNAQHAMVEVASYGVAKWMVDQATTNISISIDVAAGRGDLKFLLWAQSRGAWATTKAMDRATAHGHYDAVLWLHHNRTEGCTKDAIDQAARAGHWKIVRWLVKNRNEGFSERALLFAAIAGNLCMLSGLTHLTPLFAFPRTHLTMPQRTGISPSWSGSWTSMKTMLHIEPWIGQRRTVISMSSHFCISVDVRGAPPMRWIWLRHMVIWRCFLGWQSIARKVALRAPWTEQQQTIM